MYIEAIHQNRGSYVIYTTMVTGQRYINIYQEMEMYNCFVTCRPIRFLLHFNCCIRYAASTALDSRASRPAY